MSLIYELLYFCDNRYKQRKQGTFTIGGELEELNPDPVAREEPDQMNQDPPQGCSQDQPPTDESLNHERVQGSEQSVQEQQEEIRNPENANQDLQQRIQDLEESDQEKQATIRNLENANQELQQTNQNLKQQKDDLKRSLKNTEEQNERLNAVTEKLARAETKIEDNDKYQTEIDGLKERLMGKEIELKGTTTKLEYTQKEMNEYKTKCAKLEEDCERYRSKSEELDKKLREAMMYIELMTDDQATLLSGKGDGKDDRGLGEHLRLLV